MMKDPTDSLNISLLKSGPPGASEASFDSGYTSSPSHLFTAGLSPLKTSDNLSAISTRKMDDKKVFIPSHFKSPHKNRTNSLMPGDLQISPLRKNTATFSPFKDSTLSPFKGTFDDWDKEFIAGFEENLFGMNELPEHTIEELLKSPEGKAFLIKRKDSPMRSAIQSSTVARKLRISPAGKAAGSAGHVFQHIQPTPETTGNTQNAFSNPAIHIKREPAETIYNNIYIKQEPIECDADLYGYSSVPGQALNTQCVNVNNILTVTDPNKMSATPIKPKYTCVDKVAPKRKLSMKIQGEPEIEIVERVVPVVQPAEKENIAATQTVVIREIWPPKERLKFARCQFKLVLEKAVKDDAMKMAEIKQEQEAKVRKKTTGHNRPNKLQFNKQVKNSKSSKNKVTKKGNKKDNYPQIKLALGKSAVVNNFGNTSSNKTSLPAPHSQTKPYDPGWYPSDEDTESWQGPPPFSRQQCSGFYDDSDIDNGSWDEEFWMEPTVKSKKSAERPSKRRKY